MSDISLNYSSCFCHHTLQFPPFLQVSPPLQCVPSSTMAFHVTAPCVLSLSASPHSLILLLLCWPQIWAPGFGPAAECGSWPTRAWHEISEQVAAVTWGATVPLPSGDPWWGPCILAQPWFSLTRSSGRNPSPLTLPAALWPQAAPAARLNSPSHRHNLGMLSAVGLDTVPSLTWARRTTSLPFRVLATCPWALSTEFLLLCHPEEKKQNRISVTAELYQCGWDVFLVEFIFYYYNPPNTTGRCLVIYKTI